MMEQRVYAKIAIQHAKLAQEEQQLIIVRAVRMGNGLI